MNEVTPQSIVKRMSKEDKVKFACACACSGTEPKAVLNVVCSYVNLTSSMIEQFVKQLEEIEEDGI